MQKMQNCAIAIQEWMIVNKMALNVPKNEFFIIGILQQYAKLNDLLLKVDGCIVKSTKEARNLGAIFDDRLTFRTHIACLS